MLTAEPGESQESLNREVSLQALVVRIGHISPGLFVPPPVRGNYREMIFHQPISWHMLVHQVLQEIAILGFPEEPLCALQGKCTEFCGLWRQEWETVCRTGVRVEPEDYEQDICVEEDAVSAMVEQYHAIREPCEPLHAV